MMVNKKLVFGSIPNHTSSKIESSRKNIGPTPV